MATDTTAHLDGYRPVVEYGDEGPKALRIVLHSGGKPYPEDAQGVLVRSFNPDLPEAQIESIVALAEAMCMYLNTGGTKHMMERMAECLATLPYLPVRYELVSVDPPALGYTVTWKKIDDTFLRVVYGEDGFSEVLTEQQVESTLKDELKAISGEEGEEL